MLILICTAICAALVAYKIISRHIISLLTQFNNQCLLPISPPSPSHHYVAAYRPRYRLDLLALANCIQQHPPPPPPFLTSITTPLNIAAWAQELENHPDKEFAQYLLQSISQGFRFGFNYPRECQSAKSNMKSAKENSLVIDEYLVKECSLGHILGPLNPSTLSGVHIRRFRVIPKKHAQNEWRMILDFSSPEGCSVAVCCCSCCSTDSKTVP